MRKLLLIFLIIFSITLTGCRATPSKPDTNTSSNAVSEEVENDKSELPNLDSSSGSSVSSSASEVSSVPQQSTESKDSKPPISKPPNPPSHQTEEKPPVVKEQPQPEASKPETSQSVPVVPEATASDSIAIANKVIEYINRYRQEQGVSPATRLSGLTQYAEYRSRQLVSNFAHDTNDERAAATALKYGEYIDPALYGMTGEPYYTVNAVKLLRKADIPEQ